MATPINLVPIMSSYTAPSGVVSQNYVRWETSAPWMAFDRNADTLPWIDSQPGWIQYEFEVARTITAYSITHGYNNYLYAPTAFTFKASTTGLFAGEEVTLDSQTGIAWTSYEKKTFSFTNTTEYKYYRVTTTASSHSGGYIQLREMEFLGVIPAKAHMTGTASMTASITGTPLARMTGTATLSATGTLRVYDYDFTVLQELELSSVAKTFNVIQELELTPSVTVIKRINT